MTTLEYNVLYTVEQKYIHPRSTCTRYGVPGIVLRGTMYSIMLENRDEASPMVDSSDGCVYGV